MSEKLKIIVDDNGLTKLWLNGIEIHGITRIKFEVEAGSTGSYPTLETDFFVMGINFGGENNEK